MTRIHFSSLFSVMLLLSPLPLPAMVQEITNISECEADVIAHNADARYIYLGKDHSPLAEIVADISAWDEDKNSLVCQLNTHINDGYSIAFKDAVLETL